jgi:hypothetical protein
MIAIDRGEEPDDLVAERSRQLARAEPPAFGKRPREQQKFTGYDTDPVGELLTGRQGYRCAYCELPVDVGAYPIEHVRPKARADDVDWSKVEPPPDGGSFFTWFDEWLAVKTHWIQDHDRYWWLAWTWENLLVLCPTCNTVFKRNYFPTKRDSGRLRPLDQPPGGELPLLVDPSRVHPLDHIRFGPDLERGGWGPIGLTDEGRWTIAVLGLNKRPGLRDHWRNHARQIVEDPGFQAIREAICAGKVDLANRWTATAERLLGPHNDFLALRYCVIDYYVGEKVRLELGLPLRPPGRLSALVPKPIWELRDEFNEIQLPEALQYRARALGGNEDKAIVERLIVDLCREVPMAVATLERVLRRDAPYLTRAYLSRLATGPASPLVLDAVTQKYGVRE